MKLQAFSLLLGTLFYTQQANAKINFVEYDLPNGLHVILHEDHTTPIVAVTVMYHVGSKNEDPKRTGFAHFFEHLLFEGTDNIKRGEFEKLVQNAGGEINANTTQDRTFYYEELPSNQLELALWMESERMLHAKIDSTGVETQRKVVKEEKKERMDNTPYGQLQNVAYENSFSVHPYRWTPIGKEQYIDEATINEFRDFYKKFYIPNNAVLVIAGDLDVNKSKEMIAKYFATIPKGTPISRTLPQEPEQTAEKRTKFYDNVQLPAVVFTYHLPKRGTDDYYAMKMLMELLSSGRSSRLYREIVDREQKAVAAGAFTYDLEDPDIIMMYSIANQGITPQDLEKSMDGQVDRVKNDLVTDEEFEKIKNQLESNFIRKNEDLGGIAEILAADYTFDNNANLINTAIEHYSKITKDDLKRVAQKYFTKENRLVVYYLPKK